MEKKKLYKCALCGKEYEGIPERARCESACVDKQLKLEEKAKKEKKKQEQEVRRQEVVAAIKHASSLLDAYTNDYGSFHYDYTEDIEDAKADKPLETKSEASSDCDWLGGWPFTSKLFHHFW